jgi:hypothetical protein
MFNVSKIRTNLYGVVGFRQPLNPNYAKLDAPNQASSSGLFVTDNPYAKIEYLYDNVDYKGLSDAQFNTLLKQMQEESITNISARVFNEADFIDRNLLYQFAQNKVNIDTLPNGFIGYKICVANEKNVAFKISRVLLDFDLTGTFDLMLFNSANIAAPLFTKPINITTSHQEEVLDWVVDNSGKTYKGDYYLGYISDGSVKPFKRDYENSDIPSNITYLDIEKISVAGHTGSTLFDLDSTESIDEATGLNPDITVYYDYTDLIIQNKMLFAEAINLDLQINVLSQYLSSLRSNRNERESERVSLRVIQEIEGQEGEGLVKITGLRPQLNRSISRIADEIQKIKRGYFGDWAKIDTMI